MASDLLFNSTEVPEVPELDESLETRAQAPDLIETRTVEDILHKLSQPLTTMSGCLELALLGDRSAADYQQLISQAMGEAYRAVRMIRAAQELLSISAHEEIQTFEIATLFREQVLDCKPLIESKSLHIKAEIAPALKLAMSRDRLSQAIAGVLGYSIRHCPQGGEIRIEGTSSTSGVDLMLESDAVWSSPEEASECVNPFRRGRKLKEEEMDLCISQRIMEVFGGTLTAIGGTGQRRRFELKARCQSSLRRPPH